MVSVVIKHPLTKVAIVGGLISLGGALWMENKIQSNFRKQDYYTKSISMLHSYEPAAQFLGHPIYGGKLILSDTDKLFVDGLSAKLEIPLRGSKDKGVLYVLASREKLGDSWTIDQLDLQISSTKQKWKFYDRQLQKETISKNNTDVSSPS